MTFLAKLTCLCWRLLKEVAGENDYARYCRRAGADGAELMTAEQFYVFQLRQKYSHINRCC